MKKNVCLTGFVFLVMGFVRPVLAETLYFSPVEDNWILTKVSEPNLYGDTTPTNPANIDLRVGYIGSQDRQYRSFIKFDLSDLPETSIVSAKLYIHGYDSTYPGTEGGNANLDLGIYEVADDTWTWNTITWNNQPAYGDLACNYGSTDSSNRQENGWLFGADVTSSIASLSDGLWSVCLKPIVDQVAINTSSSLCCMESRYAPYLAVEIEDTYEYEETAILPIDDTWVLEWLSDPSEYLNYTPKADNVELRTGFDTASNRHYHLFMKYDLSQLPNVPIISARLELNVRPALCSAKMDLGFYEVADDTWSEDTITWANQPAYGDLLYDYGMTAAQQTDGWLFPVADVTSSIASSSDDLWSVCLRSISDKAEYTVTSFNSTSTNLQPCLVIRHEPIVCEGAYQGDFNGDCIVDTTDLSMIVSDWINGPVDSLVAWYEFDETSGTVAADSSGNGYDGIVYGDSTWVSGYYGNAIDCNSVSPNPSDPNLTGSRIVVDANALIGISDQITLTLWQNGDPAVQPVADYCFDASRGIVDAEQKNILRVHIPHGDSRVYWDAGGDHPSSYDRVWCDADPNDYAGQWNHWAFTKNASTGVMNIYLNGELKATGTDRTRLMDNGPFAIGSRLDKNTDDYDNYYEYDGMIDDLRIYSMELRQDQIQAIMYDDDLAKLVTNVDDSATVNLADFAALASEWLSCGWNIPSLCD